MIKSAEQFVWLRTSEDINLYQRAANESANEEIWQAVIEKHPEMRVWVVHNKTVPIGILDILSHDQDWRVRHAVAQKHKVGQDILQRLAQDPHESVRLRVACNAKTPKIVLEQLLNDQWSEVATKAKNRLQAEQDHC